jgi:hypothetical protein
MTRQLEEVKRLKTRDGYGVPLVTFSSAALTYTHTTMHGTSFGPAPVPILGPMTQLWEASRKASDRKIAGAFGIRGIGVRQPAWLWYLGR